MTQQAAIEDLIKSGARRARGEAHGIAKLTRWQVLDMRRRYLNGDVSMATLAKSYGVGTTTVRKVLHGETWAWLEEPKEAACQ